MLVHLCIGAHIKRVTVMIPADIHRQLKIHAVSNDTTLQDLIMKAIKDHLQSECKTVENISDSAYS